MDIVLLENGEFYFIEANVFGKEYSSGSSLFHWVLDDAILKGSDNSITFRFIASE
jgi:hypothetical protein